MSTHWTMRTLGHESTLTKTIAEAEADKLGNILVNVKAKPLVDTLGNPLIEANSETLGSRLGDVEADVLKTLRPKIRPLCKMLDACKSPFSVSISVLIIRATFWSS